jgi:aldehyde:ferredoxin oxidoreductase
MMKGWAGKRLHIDLSLRKTWTEDIPLKDLGQWIGGRGLNASYFSQHVPLPVSPSAPENPIAFAVGPLTATLAPCSGWTSIASHSPLSAPSNYAYTRMPGHFGASLKWAGFDQCILQGKADGPVYLWIDDGKVKFQDASHLWGKETTETTVAIQEEKGDRDIEVLCIGPAGERKIPFANVIHRLSSTGDDLGLGYLFGVKQLKAIAIRGKKPVKIHNPQRFLSLCLALKDKIKRDLKTERFKEEGSDLDRQWAASLKTYFSGQESCFACPIPCSRNTGHQETPMGGIHHEKAWHLGPKIGIYDSEWTLKLSRLCHAQGLDPFLTGSFLAGIREDVREDLLSEEMRGQTGDLWDQGEKAIAVLHRILDEGWNDFHRSVPPLPSNEDLHVLADIVSFCTIVVNRLNPATTSNMIDLISAATGYALSAKDLKDRVLSILRTESGLRNKGQIGKGQIKQILIREDYRHEQTDYRVAS